MSHHIITGRGWPRADRQRDGSGRIAAPDPAVTNLPISAATAADNNAHPKERRKLILERGRMPTPERRIDQAF